MENYYMQDTKRNFISVHFPSVTDLLDYQPKWKGNAAFFNDTINHKRGEQKWIGPTATNGKQIVKFALLGDHKLYEDYLKDMIARLRKETGRFDRDYTQQIKSVRRRPKFNSHGDELDIHKVYQGQLDTAWRRTERIEVAQETKLVTLFIQTAGNSYVDAVKTLWRAAVAVLLMEDLLKAGKSVKVVVGAASTNVTEKGHDMTVSMTVKDYNSHLSVERLAAMCHMGFHRTFCFAAKACQPYQVRFSMGHAASVANDMMPLQFMEDIHKGHSKFVVLNLCDSLHGAVNSINSALEQMKEFT